MIQKIKNYFTILSTAVLLMGLPLVPAAVSAAGSNGCTTNTAGGIAQGASQAVNDTVNCTDTGSATNGIGQVAAHVVNIFSIIVGIVAVIMIIYGGFRYITSGGESGSVGNAKNTLIYAIVGLIIVALAQVIVHFVLSTTNNVST